MSRGRYCFGVFDNYSGRQYPEFYKTLVDKMKSFGYWNRAFCRKGRVCRSAEQAFELPVLKELRLSIHPI